MIYIKLCTVELFSHVRSQSRWLDSIVREKIDFMQGQQRSNFIRLKLWFDFDTRNKILN